MSDTIQLKRRNGPANATLARGEPLVDLLNLNLWVGDGTTNHMLGTMFPAIKTASYTQSTYDGLVVMNATVSTTISLLAVSTVVMGKPVVFKNVGSGAVTLTANGIDTIDGAASLVLYQYESATLVPYAAGKWMVI